MSDDVLWCCDHGEWDRFAAWIDSGRRDIRLRVFRTPRQEFLVLCEHRLNQMIETTRWARPGSVRRYTFRFSRSRRMCRTSCLTRVRGLNQIGTPLRRNDASSFLRSARIKRHNAARTESKSTEHPGGNGERSRPQRSCQPDVSDPWSRLEQPRGRDGGRSLPAAVRSPTSGRQRRRPFKRRPAPRDTVTAKRRAGSHNRRALIASPNGAAQTAAAAVIGEDPLVFFPPIFPAAADQAADEGNSARSVREN